MRSPEGCVHPVTSIDALKCPEARAPMIAVPCGTEDRKKTTYSGGTVQALDLLPRLRSRM